MSPDPDTVTASFYVNVKDISQADITKLQKELNTLLMTYQENGQDVTISLVYY